MEAILDDLVTAVALLCGLFIALELGFRAGRGSAAENDPKAAGQVGAIQGAALGLLGLLLGFSFAAAGARFLERQDLIVREANAIGTAYLRADLLDAPAREGLKGAIETYTKDRIAMTAELRSGVTEASAAKIAALHAAMWKATTDGVTAKPAAMVVVVPAVNDVIDLHSLRLAAGQKHLPYLVMGLLVACSLVAMAVIGFGCGLSGKRRGPMTMALGLLIGSALWITIDLDHPRAGLLQLSDAPLEALRFESAVSPSK